MEYTNNTNITAATKALAHPVKGFNTDLFAAFVKYLDRTDRTTNNYLTNLKQFGAWINYKGIEQPIRDDIISYKNWLSSDHVAIDFINVKPFWKYRTDTNGNMLTVSCKPATVRLYLQSIKQLFKWTAISGIYPDIATGIHAPKVRTDIHKKDAFTPSEVLAIEQSIEKNNARRAVSQAQSKKDTTGRIQRNTEQGLRLKAMYLLAVNAGLRTVEISRANIRDLECKNGQAWLYIWGKGHTEPDTRKAIAAEVAKAIQDYINTRTDTAGNSPLFVATGNRSKGKRIDPTTISKMLKAAMIDAGFNSERLTAHSLRHTAGTAVQGLTGDLYKTQKYMRHASPVTTEIYLHADTEKEEAAIAENLYTVFHQNLISNSTNY